MSQNNETKNLVVSAYHDAEEASCLINQVVNNPAPERKIEEALSLLNKAVESIKTYRRSLIDFDDNISVRTMDGVYIEVTADDPVFLKTVDPDGTFDLRCPFCRIIEAQMDITGKKPHRNAFGDECNLPIERVGFIETLDKWVMSMGFNVACLSRRIKVRPYWSGVLRTDDARQLMRFIADYKFYKDGRQSAEPKAQPLSVPDDKNK